MAGSVNKVILLGYLGKDPEVRTTQDGKKITNLNLATSESWKDRQTGERKEKSEWHRVVIFNEHIADIADRYLKKGSRVYIEGALQTRKWTDQQGVEKYSTEIVLGNFKGELTLLDNRSDGDDSDQGRGQDRQGNSNGGGYGGGNQRGSSGQRSQGGAGWEPPADMDDEIPF